MNTAKLFYRFIWSSRAGLNLLTLLLVVLSVALAQAQGPHRAGLVIFKGEGAVIKHCIDFDEDEIDGYELLRRSGLDLNADFSNGMGAAICRIDGQGCSYPAESCFCQCQDPCTFWIYWYLHNGEWQFSSQGASNTKIKDGDVTGWVWGQGSPSSGGTKPPLVTFEEICAAAPTNTPSPTSSPTSTSVPTDTPTPKPASTYTPTPIATPVIRYFTSDRSVIKIGESVTLNWDLAGAKVAYLRYNDSDEGVVSPGSKTLSPNSTTTYQLMARNDGGETVAEITITVDGSIPSFTPTYNPTSTTPPVQTVAPLAASAPEPIINFGAGSLTVPAGACTTLTWTVQHANIIYLDDSKVDWQGSRAACPPQTQLYTLRALYPGGERVVQVTLKVVETPSDLMGASSPVPSSTAVVSPTTSTIASIAVTPAAAPTRPIRQDLERNRAIAVGQEKAQTRQLLIYSSMAVAVILFLAAPIALLTVGSVAWWLRGRK